MGVVARSTKAGSTTSFAESFGLGNILAVADLDTDLDTLFALVNGGIDTTNITDDSLTAADLAADSVGTSELQNSAVATANLADLAVTTAKLSDGAVTPAKAATIGYATGTCVANATITTETTLATASITVVGGPVALLASLGTSVILVGTSPKAITWRWKRDGTLIGALIQNVSGPAATSIQIPVQGPPLFDPDPTPGVHAYTLSVETDATIQTPALFPGSIMAKELVS